MWQVLLSLLVLLVIGCCHSFYLGQPDIGSERNNGLYFDCSMCSPSNQLSPECLRCSTFESKMIRVSRRGGFFSSARGFCMCCVHSRNTNTGCCGQCYGSQNLRRRVPQYGVY